MRKLLIFLIIVVGLLVVVDRVALVAAQREVGNRVAATYDLPDKPEVKIGGFPFLTQAVAGRFDRIDVSVDTLPVAGVRIDRLDARFSDVRAPLGDLLGPTGAANATADRAAGTALVPFAAIQSRLPRGVRLAEDGGDLNISGKISYLGIQVDVSATVALEVTEKGIVATPQRATAGNRVQIPLATLRSRLGFTIPLRDLPMRLRLTGVDVRPEGLLVSASAQDVRFADAVR